MPKPQYIRITNVHSDSAWYSDLPKLKKLTAILLNKSDVVRPGWCGLEIQVPGEPNYRYIYPCQYTRVRAPRRSHVQQEA